VIGWAKAFLDDAVPLDGISWTEWTGGAPPLADPAQLVGHAGANILLRHNGLHLELVIDRDHPVGRDDPAGLADIILESALSTIVDLEDSIAAVDAEDKVAAYANWLGLMKGDAQRELRQGRRDDDPDDGGRSRLYRARRHRFHFARPQPDVRAQCRPSDDDARRSSWPTGSEAPEGIVDAIFTSLIGLHDLRRQGAFVNSRAGSIYIVKPKMHGPDEAAFTNDLFDAVEDLLGLERHTVKVGADGRGAPHLGQSGGVHRSGPSPHRLHQHRLPRSHRRRDAHVDAGGADDPQGRDEGQRLDQGL
jgi:malate synthase